MALLFAERDFNNPADVENSSLARKKETVQQIYNADYRFARPPNKPTVRAIAGDGQVTLVWDDVAEKSFDPFLREHDFEGYLVYRSTEPNFEENLLITDAFGNTVFQKPLAQFDLKNGLRGLHPVAVNGVQFNLGTDTGLQHTYIDRNVTNGETYYYAVVAYDRGLVARNGDGSVQTDPDGAVRGLSPSLTTAVVKNDVAGNIVVDMDDEVIRGATAEWLNRHFPILRSAPLLMRASDDDTSIEVRRQHIDRVRNGGRIVLVSDNLDMPAILAPGDQFVHAPRDWRWLRQMITLASR